ncbi:hypothetical protein V6R98_27520 [Agrobacterium sp. CCNWLW71]|uniref:hypothetical protein n=1 Tax=unclassified Agrobacterium TaxID=2632611 RepID=UPI002FEF55AF
MSDTQIPALDHIGADRKARNELLLRALKSHDVRITETAELPKSIANIYGFHIVIAASGMSWFLIHKCFHGFLQPLSGAPLGTTSSVIS